MLRNIVWIRETKRAKIAVVSTSNWKSGIPKNPNIPKYLVWIWDKWIEPYGTCPTDRELVVVANTLPLTELLLVAEAFDIKEEHNYKNLKNPESRKKENIFRQVYFRRKSRGERIN